MFNIFGSTQEKFKNIFCDELENIITGQKQVNEFEVLDVRTPEEYQMGHIPHSKLINLMDPAFAEKVHQLDKSKTYYVYCRSGSRSMTASRIMVNAGFEEVYNVKFGLMGWQGPLNR